VLRRRLLVVLTGLLMTAPLLVSWPAGPASALPAVCVQTTDNVYRWTGTAGDHRWGTPGNWEHGSTDSPGVPNDDVSHDSQYTPGTNGDTSDTIVCVNANDSVDLNFDNFGLARVWIQELYVEGAFTISIGDGCYGSGRREPDGDGHVRDVDLGVSDHDRRRRVLVRRLGDHRRAGKAAARRCPCGPQRCRATSCSGQISPVRGT